MSLQQNGAVITKELQVKEFLSLDDYSRTKTYYQMAAILPRHVLNTFLLLTSQELHGPAQWNFICKYILKRAIHISGAKGQTFVLLVYCLFLWKLLSYNLEAWGLSFDCQLDACEEFCLDLTNRRAAAIYCMSHKRSAHCQ